MSEKKINKEELKEALDEKRMLLENAYEEMAERLRDETSRLERDLRHEYRNARRYVRANPERGIGIAFASGLLTGVVIAKLLTRS
ncbi:MAG: DUF883 C-terminal domain-containing protein [Balneolaceae bacterium]